MSDTRLRRFARSLLPGLVVLAFGMLGLVATPIAMLWAFAPGGDCPSPCDGPAYVALGLSLFVAPVVAVAFALSGGWAIRRWQRRRSLRADRVPGDPSREA